MKGHFLDTKYALSIIVFLGTFKRARDTNSIYEGAAIWVLPHYVKEVTANVLDSGMCTVSCFS